MGLGASYQFVIISWDRLFVYCDADFTQEIYRSMSFAALYLALVLLQRFLERD